MIHHSNGFIPLFFIFIVASIVMVSSEAAASPIGTAEANGSSLRTKDSSTLPMEEHNASTTKTIFLVRHAESEENRRIGSLKAAFKALTRFSLPKSKDIVAACELIRVDQQIDSNVSEFGQKQIQYMANVIQEANFMKKHQIQLVAHSPLVRARETCRGMFGVAASDPSPATTVCELAELTEMTPAEWIPGNSGSLYQRFRALEEWITRRPEDSMVLVGHSQFFKALLQLDYKFGNCDVIQVQFHAPKEQQPKTAATVQWKNVTPLHLCRIPPTPDAETAE
jgi:phosphohistidine phosphatase SixA